MTPLFRQILIANRGEIAIRIARAAADLDISSLAVFAEDDSQSLHVRKADRAVPLTGRGVKAYLDIEQIIAIAQQEGCDAVHPGYGFLSENAELSRRCREAGITFIGASPELLEQLGNKAIAREVAARSDTPMVGGINRACTLGEVQDFFAGLGDGAAVMIKALAGGGGRGMRAVTRAEDLETAYQQCQEEATIAFGSGDVYVEQLVQNARHIEVQILGDGRGGAVHAWERECTLQRRNQKLLEIAPSPSLSDAERTPIIESACRLASDVQYQGLGTFEFLLDAADHSKFYFMEINPRIQVEHTITEEITGLDLVRNQILLAAGAGLDELGLSAPPPRDGCAIQARINLETMLSDGGTRPASGVIGAYQMPGGRGIRVDDYLYGGYRVSPSYDSLGAKLIVSGADYGAALKKIYRCLQEVNIEGVASNKALLLNLVQAPSVLKNQLNTRYVEEHIATLVDNGSHNELFFRGESLASTEQAGPAIPADCNPLACPSAGTLVSLEVEPGSEVYEGQVVAYIEAMKMEFPIAADQDGVLVEFLVTEPGAVIDEGQAIAALRPGEVSVERDLDDEELDLDAIRPDLAEALERNAGVLDAARPQAIAKRHERGKRTARENVADLLDDNSFNEYGALVVAAQRKIHDEQTLREISPADGIITGIGAINGDLFPGEDARCAVLAYDYTVMVGTQGLLGHKKTDRLAQLAKQWRLPLVAFAEGGGGRPNDTDTCAANHLDVHTFSYLGELSGLVPTVGIVSGNCFAGNAAVFGVMDLTIATRDASVGMAGPAMIEGGGLGVFKASEVGPVSVQEPNGVFDIVVEDEAEAVAVAKQYLGYFQGALPEWETHDQRLLRHLVPENRMQIYDIRQVIETLADVGSVLELRRNFARNAVTALVRIEGKPYGLFANDPHHLGGAIDAAAGDKIARFIQLCDAHDLPIISLVDTPGFMVGPEAEKQATVRHISRIFVNAANITVPLFSVVLRKSYGLGAQAMAGGGFANPMLAVSWPSGEFGPMGFEGAVRLAYRRQLEAIEDPEERHNMFSELVAQMYENGKALHTAAFLEIDAVVDPLETRDWLVRARSCTPAPAPRQGKKRPCIDTW